VGAGGYDVGEDTKLNNTFFFNLPLFGARLFSGLSPSPRSMARL